MRVGLQESNNFFRPKITACIRESARIKLLGKPRRIMQLISMYMKKMVKITGKKSACIR